MRELLNGYINAPYPVWAVDAYSLRFLAANDAALHRYGYQRDHFLALCLDDITAAEERAMVDVLRGDGKIQSLGPWSHRTATGQRCYVDLVIGDPIESRRGTYRVFIALDAARRTASTNVEQQNETVKRLRGAISGNNLVLLYQPIIELPTRRVRAVEALLRFRNPNGTLESPLPLLEVAEGSDLLMPLEAWVVEHAGAFALRLQHAGYDVPVAMNVSPGFFASEQGPRLIAQAAAHLAPHRLWVEIVESAYFMDIERANAAAEDIRACGARLVIDDFGVGYSALGRLKHLPISVLKLDRSFVTDLPDSDFDKAVIEAVVSFARWRNVDVVAEGVETPAQQTALEALGCTLIQGFGVAKPLTSEALLQFLARSRTAA